MATNAGLTSDKSRNTREAVKTGNIPTPMSPPQIGHAELGVLREVANRMSRRRAGMAKMLEAMFRR